MNGMPMPAATFLGMWVLMMIAMMLPSLTPTLWRFRKAGLGRLTALVAVAYFLVWAVFGIAAYPVSVVLARAAPIGLGLIVLVGGVLQSTPWKAHHLACCRDAGRDPVAAEARSAWKHGVRLGLHCSQCNLGLMTILLVAGIMDRRVMAAVAVAITVERLVPSGERAARATGAVAIGAGLFLIGRAAGLG